MDIGIRGFPFEKFSQRHALNFSRSGLNLREFTLEWSERPAIFRREFFDRGSGIVERADVAEFRFFLIIQPAQRQSLSAADVRPEFVDPAGAGIIEKGAGAGRMRIAVFEQLGAVFANVLRLGLKDGDAVDATTGTPSLALQSPGVACGQIRNGRIDADVKLADFDQN